MSIKVSVVEDNVKVRDLLRALLDGTDGFTLAGVHQRAETALEQVPRERPDVLLLDLHLPGLSGLECIATLKESVPSLEILVLTVDTDVQRIFPALAAGAAGYLIKPVPPAKILDAITDIHRGGVPMSAAIARLVLKRMQSSAKDSASLSCLTARETEIMKLLADCYDTPSICTELEISKRTLESHLRNVREKLHVQTRTQAVAKFLQHQPRVTG